MSQATDILLSDTPNPRASPETLELVLPPHVESVLPRILNTNSPLLLTGETGTGKSALAEFIHKNSTRADGPFIEVSCAALPETLIESELFGYRRGAFTGPDRGREGRLSAASAGTILLDEIESIPPPVQAKLLRFLQKGIFERLGSNAAIRSSTRVIATSNQDLRQGVRRGAIREDFYQRLAVIQFELSPLRHRRAQFSHLVHLLTGVVAREQGVASIQFTADALARLSSYAWPGNVRELRNKIYACTALAETRIVDCESLLRFCHFDEGFGEDRQQELPMEEFSGATLAQIERRAILRAIRVANGDTAEAARKLGVSRRKLQYRLKEYRGDSVESPR